VLHCWWRDVQRRFPCWILLCQRRSFSDELLSDVVSVEHRREVQQRVPSVIHKPGVGARSEQLGNTRAVVVLDGVTALTVEIAAQIINYSKQRRPQSRQQQHRSHQHKRLHTVDRHSIRLWLLCRHLLLQRERLQGLAVAPPRPSHRSVALADSQASVVNLL